jgi:hypothetical protein
MPKTHSRPLLMIDVEPDSSIDGPVKCVRCKSRRVHPISVAINPAGENQGEVTADADGLHIDRTVKRLGIATQITLTFGCANGHVFSVKFVYRRGETIAGILYPSQPQPGKYRILGRDGDPDR